MRAEDPEPQQDGAISASSREPKRSVPCPFAPLEEELAPRLCDERTWKSPAELFEAENTALVRHARTLMFAYKLPQDLAEDVVQEAWADLTSQWDGIRRPLPWLYVVVKNKAVRAARPLSAQDETDLEPIVRLARWTSLSPTASLETAIEARDALRAIVALPDRQQAAAFLRFVAELDYADIAERMQIDRGTVGAHLAKARKNIGAKLGRAGAYLIILATALGVITVRPEHAEAAQRETGNGVGPDSSTSPLPDTAVSTADICDSALRTMAALEEKVARFKAELERERMALDTLERVAFQMATHGPQEAHSVASQTLCAREERSQVNELALWWVAALRRLDQAPGATVPAPPRMLT